MEGIEIFELIKIEQMTVIDQSKSPQYQQYEM